MEGWELTLATIENMFALGVCGTGGRATFTGKSTTVTSHLKCGRTVEVAESTKRVSFDHPKDDATF